MHNSGKYVVVNMLVSVGKLGNDIFDTFLSFTLVISTKFGTKQLIWNANINYRNKRSVVIQSGENLETIKKKGMYF